MKILFAIVLAACFIVIIMEINRWKKNLKEGDNLEKEEMKLARTKIKSAVIQTRKAVLTNTLKNTKATRDLGGISSELDELIDDMTDKEEPYDVCKEDDPNPTS